MCRIGYSQKVLIQLFFCEFYFAPFWLENLTSIRCLKELTRPPDPLKLVYRISRNPPDKGTSCVVVHNLENSIIFDGICLSDFGISTNMEKKTCETVSLQLVVI